MVVMHVVVAGSGHGEQGIGYRSDGQPNGASSAAFPRARRLIFSRRIAFAGICE
jgi:hypothetical protein